VDVKATDILIEEHTVIERVLDALESAVQSLEEGASVEPDFFVGVTDFVKGFAELITLL
jgi:hemerythrin-like domain-containing protein